MFSCNCKKKIAKNDLETENLSTTENQDTINQNAYFNTTKEYFLSFKKQLHRKNNPFPTVLFSVTDVKKNAVIYKDAIPGGKINWISDFVIEVKSMVARPKDIFNAKKPYILYKLNVKTLKKFK